MKIVTDWLVESGSLESGYFEQPVLSPLPEADRSASGAWEWMLRPEVRCMEQWLDFNA